MKTIGIALSGGGARGIAHLGVLKALKEFGIKPDVLSGSSAGAMVAAVYAAGYDDDQIMKEPDAANVPWELEHFASLCSPFHLGTLTRRKLHVVHVPA